MTKTILITGSTDGIGKLTATKLAKEGHNVYLHGRNADKLANVISEIKQEVASQNQTESKAKMNNTIDGFVADLSDINAVRQLADEVLSKLPKLDVLINNAGVFKVNSTTTANGLDVRFVVNYLAPYVLTESLLPLLQQSETARIVNLSSAAQAKVNFASLKGDAQLSDNEAYAQSKLALTMWSMDLADRLQDDNINVIAVNPGSLLNTRMVKEAYGQHWSSADKGANILTALATSDEFANETGKYFDNDIESSHGKERGEFGNPHADALNQQAITALMQQTEQLLSTID